jgi:Winged helix-turn helix
MERALRAGPGAHGFTTGLWTLPRVATVIQRLTGVRYNPSHVGWLLQQLDWSLQRPGRRACKHDEPTIEPWKTRRWAQLKKTFGAAAPGFPSRTKTGFSQQPVVRGTWAPRGDTPILTPTGASWKLLSITGALALLWDGRPTRVFFQTRPAPTPMGPSSCLCVRAAGNSDASACSSSGTAWAHT